MSSAPAPTARPQPSPLPSNCDAGLSLSVALQQRLRCPACGSQLGLSSERCVCLDGACGKRFAVARGVALLLDETSSLFSERQALSRLAAGPQSVPRFLAGALRRMIPALSANRVASRQLLEFRRRLLESNARPRALVVGGAWAGAGMLPLLEDAHIDWVESDVWLTERTHLVCDAHQIPFAENTFDGVVIQAVLEHVADPERCVREIHRVLKPGGLVYAETAFLQQVHAGRHDFCRFTPVGHRRLFRGFEQIAAGAAAGPAVALAWSWQHFLLGFTSGRIGRVMATCIAALTAFWLKYLDSYLLQRPAGLDAASACFFLGIRHELPLTDREAIAAYAGAQSDVV